MADNTVAKVMTGQCKQSNNRETGNNTEVQSKPNSSKPN